MDDYDQKILRILQEEGRIKIGELADRVGLTATPCARRVAMLETNEIITGYGADVSQDKLGLPVTAFISVRLDRQSADVVQSFERAISVFDEVMECHLMSGVGDILLKVVAKDLAGFNEFLEHRLMRVQGINSMSTSFALRAMIKRKALPRV
ncbi:Lrp/AsnC family transcriptional regulator [Aestuariibius sp. HNIBRBA575]|uniref:Lrp/AsnC family transcriptional regulator n=1 Tax=Aestuariibius sp. HNIBRBA575 TaxID=3233343 RepID=UPI0034A1B227